MGNPSSQSPHDHNKCVLPLCSYIFLCKICVKSQRLHFKSSYKNLPSIGCITYTINNIASSFYYNIMIAFIDSHRCWHRTLPLLYHFISSFAVISSWVKRKESSGAWNIHLNLCYIYLLDGWTDRRWREGWTDKQT